jgi:acetyltransferase-like isoleucine patch superfamily enzyme
MSKPDALADRASGIRGKRAAVSVRILLAKRALGKRDFMASDSGSVWPGTPKREQSLVRKWLHLPWDEKLDVAFGLIRGCLQGLKCDQHQFLILGPGVFIRRRNGRLSAGRVVRLRGGCRIAVIGSREKPAALSIGDGTEIGERTIINVSTRVEIGARCSVSWDCDICDTDFHCIQMEEGTPPLPVSEPIIIEDDVWIGSHCLILKGVTIGHGAVIGAGSVIRRDVPPHSLMAGNPARPVARIACWKRDLPQGM